MKKKDFKISIVIPSYNCNKTIKQCLTSIYNSDYVNFEIIVVDDASKDNTISLIKDNFKHVKIIQLTKNKKSGMARNIGAKNSKGEIIVFVDSDVSINRNTLSRINYLFNRNKDISVIQTIYSEKCPIDNFASQYSNLFQHYNFNVIKSKYIQSVSTHCCAIRKKNFINFNAEYPATVEDGEWGNKLYQNNKKILLDKKNKVKHLQQFTLKRILKKSFQTSRDKMKSIKGYKKQLNTNLNATPHNKTKMMAIFFSFLPPLFWIINRKFLYFVYKEKELVFLLKTMIFDEINYMAFLFGILVGLIYNDK